MELDRAEQERKITVQRIKDGIEASSKRSGRVMGKKIYKKFWAMGECIITENEIILRKVQDSDKHIFIELQKENNIVKSMMKEEAYRNMLW